MKVVGIIPARYGSSRLHAKPLELIGDKPMIQLTYESALKCSSLDDLVVATDHSEIIKTVESFGGKAIMTSEDHQSGTDRCFEALQKLNAVYSHVINIQGDEPLVPAEMIETLIAMLKNEAVSIATLASKIDDHKSLFDENKVKVVFNSKNKALYFSRAAIPHQKTIEPESWISTTDYYKHVGLYGFKSNVLSEITKLSSSKLESAESLEQLRWMENNYDIYVGITELKSPSIDTQLDLDKLRRTLLG